MKPPLLKRLNEFALEEHVSAQLVALQSTNVIAGHWLHNQQCYKLLVNI